jgi:mannose-1-phosphate guanylyltransferase
MSRKTGITQAVILAGGEGRRLHPYTRVLPKPLWPIGDKPIVEVLLRQLGRCGIREIIMAVGYQAELIKLLLGNGSQYKVSIRYVVEKKPLGTVGPLNNIKNLRPNFLVLNGDLLTDLNFRIFANAHLNNDAIATVAACRRSVRLDFGVITEYDDIIEDYHEKPSIRHLVSSGIYAFHRSILEFIPRGRFDFPDLITKLIKNGRPPAVYKFKGRWLDIGRPEDWEKADKLFRKKSHLFLK